MENIHSEELAERVNAIRLAALKYNTLGSARNFVNRADKLMAIVLGDDDLFWVVSLKQSTLLEQHGYTVVS